MPRKSIRLSVSTEAQAAIFEQNTRAQLLRAGYGAGIVDGAITRARGIAVDHSESLSNAIYEAGYLDNLRAQLALCERWLRKALAGMAK